METLTGETLTVVAAIIEYKQRYLILKRAAHKDNADLWEFPGGKHQTGESLQQAIEREILEELGVKATAGEVLGSRDTTVNGRVIRLIAIEVTLDRAPTQFKDHSEMKWANWKELSTYPLTTPDLGLFQSLQVHGFRERELTHLNALSCAKFYGILYAILGVFVSAFVMFTPASFSSFFSFTQKMLVVVLIPFANFFAGAFMGSLLAFCYNFFASLFGGLKMRWK
jgi:(d)CTP diphosphatase